MIGTAATLGAVAFGVGAAVVGVIALIAERELATVIIEQITDMRPVRSG